LNEVGKSSSEMGKMFKGAQKNQENSPKKRVVCQKVKEIAEKLREFEKVRECKL
jgi:hypothetical protein